MTSQTTKADSSNLPPVLAGPLLRHVTTERLAFWLVGSGNHCLRLRLTVPGQSEPIFDETLTDTSLQSIPLGKHAYLFLIEVGLNFELPVDTRIGYDLGVILEGEQRASWIREWAPHLCLPGTEQPDFVIKSRLDRLMHGSCRRPHDPASDGLCRIDDELRIAGDKIASRPALLMMTGDQIYADDVAGPMLRAIHMLIECLELFDENFESSEVSDSKALLANPHTYYQRDQLLPATKNNVAMIERFFGGVRKPVFTTSNARNHLITFAEVMSMYLLVWSPVCWRLIKVEAPLLPQSETDRYLQEQEYIDRFVAGLPRCARALAHFPTYMIFDDHDITDDWNLSALWESTAYEHPFSRRIVGNALIGYLLCQGWGNNPSAFVELMPVVKNLTCKASFNSFLDSNDQDALIDRLLTFQQWHYTLPTTPLLVVLDTRTRRWRSESARGKPSGLMDWEALTEFQQTIMGEKAVIVVSPAPIFGVKLIEVIQRVFTFCGKPLMVDAENWMAHRGTAEVLLNIFRHSRTPDHFVILSGDVHYSFVYDVRLRNKRTGPRIWQITSSGIKSEFPKRLLEWLDKLNRWLYAPWSPLNFFTKRRRMWVVPRLPTGRETGERLWNMAGIGVVELDGQGAPSEIRQLSARTGESRFMEDEKALNNVAKERDER